VVRLGFDREHLVNSIRTRQQNKATVTYWLLLDNRRRMPSSGYLSAALSEAAPAPAHHGPGGQTQQQQQQQQHGYGGSYNAARVQHGGHGHGHGGGGSGSTDNHGLPQQRLVAERKWRLGWHARGHPSALMAELYRVLQVRVLHLCYQRVIGGVFSAVAAVDCGADMATGAACQGAPFGAYG
jgi:5'-AMP-activated protein kinase catalytic alpha subunit